MKFIQQADRAVKLTLTIVFLLQAAFPATVAFGQTRSIPQWARGCVWYLILPDRFANGDLENDPTAEEIFDDPSTPWEVSSWTSNWYERSTKERMFHDTFYKSALLRQYGGDLEGISQRLDYLQSLGVDGIILTPVFGAKSSHKYDFLTLHHIDMHFGPRLAVDTTYLGRETPDDPQTWYLTAADRKFIDLLKDIHGRGMKIVISAQFVHSSVNFWAFRDLLEKQENSRFGNWFVVNDWDRPETPFESEFHYESMWGVEAFPRFRQDTLGLAAGPRKYVFDITRRWMDPNGDGDFSDGVDGWNIDLTEQLPAKFWAEWCEYARSVNPDILLIDGGSEGSGDDESDSGLRSEAFDTRFPKQFGSAVVDYIIRGRSTSTDFDRSVSRSRTGSPMLGSDLGLNLLDSHESERVASLCVNLLREGESGSNGYLLRKPMGREREVQKTLLLLQFTYPGSPVIYYGDEAGMWGGGDPDCRKPMIWPDIDYEAEVSFEVNGDIRPFNVRFDSSMYAWYRRLMTLRDKHLALRNGSVRTLIIDDVASLYAFARESGADKLYIVINASDKPQYCKFSLFDVPEGMRLDDPLSGVHFFVRRGNVSFVLPPKSGTVLIPAM